MKQLIHIVAVCAGLLLSMTSHGQSLGFLQDTVLGSLTEVEVDSFKALIRETLYDSPDAMVIEWSSPDGSKAGKVLPRFTYETNGRLCRRSLFQVGEVDGRRENYRFDLCQIEGGWEVAEAPASLSSRDRERLQEFIVNSLEQQEDGLPLNWNSGGSGHNAVIVPLAMADVAENCRMAAITLVDRGGQSLNGRYLFCKNSAGEWEYEPGPEPEAIN